MSATLHCPNCQQGWPRVPRFCPYCGQAQAQAAAPAVAATAAVAPAVALAKATASAPAPAPTPAAPKAPSTPATPATSTTSGTSTTSAAPASSATSAPPSPKPAAATPPRPAPGKIPPFLPPKPKAGRWRQGLALVLLGGILLWWVATPDKQTVAIQKKVAQLTEQVKNCELDQASETVERLKKLDPSQYRHWLNQIDAAQPGCAEQRARARDWQATLAVANKALADAGFDKADYERANARLNSFVKRWKDDPETRALKKRLDASYALLLLDLAERCLAKGDTQCARSKLVQWERLKQDSGQERANRVRAMLPARSAPEPAAGSSSRANSNTTTNTNSNTRANSPVTAKPSPAAQTSAALQIKQLLTDAEQAMGWGDYKGAAAKMTQCLALPDKGNAVCSPIKRRAEQLQQEMLRCVSAGHEWIGERCDKSR